MLSGVEPESERSRSPRGICETRVRYSYVCHGRSLTPRIAMALVGTPAIRRCMTSWNEPMPPPTVTRGTSTTGMPARWTMSSVQTGESISSWVRSPRPPMGPSCSSTVVPGVAMTCCPVICGTIGPPGGGAWPGTHPTGGALGGALRGGGLRFGGTPGAREVTVLLLSLRTRTGNDVGGSTTAPLGLVDERPLAELDAPARHECDRLVPGHRHELLAA